MKRRGLSLRPLQAAILPKILAHTYYLLIWQMRAGKTWPALLAAQKRNIPCIIVCPANVREVWHKAIKELGITIEIEVLSSGAFSNPHMVYYGDKIIPTLHKHFTLIIDEIQGYRSYSNRFKNLLKLRKLATYFIGLTGTPIDKDLEEYFYIWQLMDLGSMLGTSRHSFRNKCCDAFVQGRRITYALKKEFIRPFNEMIAPFVSIYRPTEIDTPEVRTIKFPLTVYQKYIIRDLSLRMENRKPNVNLDGHNVFIEGSGVGPKIMQVTSGFWIRPDGSIYDKIDTNKFIELQKLFRDTIKDAPTIIWVRFIREYDLVIQALKGYSRAKYSKKTFKAFTEGEISILVCHPKSAGVGLDMSSAHYAVFLTESLSNIDSLQASARLNVYGGAKKKVIYYLLADTPHVMKVQKTMEKKQQTTQMIYEDGTI